MASDPCLLKLFDPLKSPVTPQYRRRIEHESPMTALFAPKHTVVPARRNKEVDLIDLGNNMSCITESDEDPAAADEIGLPHVGSLVDVPSIEETYPYDNEPLRLALSIPLPPSPSFDPFSPPSLKSSNSLNTFAQLSSPIPAAGAQISSQFAMSTNFAPIPSGLPYLLHASLSELRASSTSDAIRPRRSSIDLGELDGHLPDASFDILRGELELGNSADVSFVSSGVEEAIKISSPVRLGANCNV